MISNWTSTSILSMVSLFCGLLPPRADSQVLDNFYLGGGVSSAAAAEQVSLLSYEASAPAISLFSGYQWSQSFSAELALHRVSEVGGRDLLGSGLDRFDIITRTQTASVRARLTIDFRELFDWRRRIALFATAGVHETRAVHEIRELNSNLFERIESTDVGLALGGGVLHERGKMSLRGYIDWFDRPGESKLLVLGIGAEYRFSRAPD